MTAKGPGTPAAAQHRTLRWLMLAMLATAPGLTAWRHRVQSDRAAALAGRRSSGRPRAPVE